MDSLVVFRGTRSRSSSLHEETLDRKPAFIRGCQRVVDSGFAVQVLADLPPHILKTALLSFTTTPEHYGSSLFFFSVLFFLAVLLLLRVQTHDQRPHRLTLPAVLWSHVLGWCNTKERMLAYCVCEAWRQLVLRPASWTTLDFEERSFEERDFARYLSTLKRAFPLALAAVQQVSVPMQTDWCLDAALDALNESAMCRFARGPGRLSVPTPTWVPHPVTK